MKSTVMTFVLATALSFAGVARADVLGGWTFENVFIGGTGTDWGPIVADAAGQVFGGEARGHHSAPVTTWSFPAGNGSLRSFSSNNWSAGDYYQFRTSSTGYQNISIAWHQTRSLTGPDAFSLMWSLDGLAWNPLTPGYTVSAITWTSTPPPQPPFFGPTLAPPVLDNQPFIYFRLVSLVTPASGGTNRVDNVVISGTAIPLPTGACCVGSVCLPNLTAGQCTTQIPPGIWQGAGTDCFPNPCVPIAYYWDTTTGEQGGTGYNGQWIFYPNAPGGPWYNMWWPNEFALDRQKSVTLSFNVEFPLGAGFMEVAIVRATPDWALVTRPPLENEEQFIEREFLGPITTAGTFTFPILMPYCPKWVSIDVRGSGYQVQGNITHICLPGPQQGACCQPDGSCLVTSQSGCLLPGIWHPEWTTCTPNPCPQPTGACCVGLICQSNLTQAECSAQTGGVWQGANTDCFPNPCDTPPMFYYDPVGDEGGTGYQNTWYVYPNYGWVNMWWDNEYSLDRQKMIDVTVDVVFPPGPTVANVIVTLNWATPAWTAVGLPRPPLPGDVPTPALEDLYIGRYTLGEINSAQHPQGGRFTFHHVLPFCPDWISMDLMGAGYQIQGTIIHTCLPLPTGACCVGWNCSIQEEVHCVNDLHGRYLGNGTTCALNPCAITDVVKCEPQPPNHPTTYWYDVTPGGGFGRCDFHVQVFDSNAANYTNIVMPPTWQFAIHQVGTQWWASWWDADCSNAIYGLFRFQFDHPNAAQWGHWRTTISATNDPANQVIDQSENHATLADGYGYRVHVPSASLPTGACCVGWDCSIQERIHCVNVMHGRYLGDGTTCDAIVAQADPNLPIPDGIATGVSNTLDFPLSTPIIGARIDVIISHANLADLRVSVAHGLTSVTLWDGRCPGNQDMNVVFSDAGTGLVCGSPTLGTIAPSSAGGTVLAAFDGQDSIGPWTLVVSDIVTGNIGTLLHWSVHVPGNPCAVKDRVVCEAQPPNHPNTFWYDVTPGGGFGRCDFHVEVFDPNPAHYTNVIMPPTWQFAVHQVGTQWWASWWDPDCDNAIFDPNPTRFQFTNTSASTWGQWRTTISANNDPFDVRTIDESGHHVSEPDGSGYRVHVPVFTEAWYWKDCNDGLDAGYLPDFDQRQDFNGDGVADAGYCGPTAVANSIWWFNCKYPAAGIVPANWTAVNLVQDLAQRMATNGQTVSPHGHPTPYSGTYLDDMQSGIDSFLLARGVNNLLYEHTEINPTFAYISDEVQRSQDVTLLVGFWHIEAANFNAGTGVWTITWRRTGGHYLTVAGVDPLNNHVALSDPDGDYAEHSFSGMVRPAGTDHNHDGDNNPNTTISFRNAVYNHAVHNTDSNASHDYYTLLPSISPGGRLALVMDGNPLTYGQEMQAYHLGENDGPFPSGVEIETPNVSDGSVHLLWPDPGVPFVPPTQCQFYAEVEAAVVVSPFEDCGPKDDGQGCEPVQCPVPTQECLPKRIRHHLPTIVFPLAGTDHLSPTTGHMEIMDPVGNILGFTIQEGPPNATTVVRENPMPVGDHREIATEITQLDLVAGGGGGGGAIALIRESPTLPSHGRVIGAANATTDYPADSFFDVFVEIDIPTFGAIGLRNEAPIPLSAHEITAVPPLGASFATPIGWSGVELYTPGGQPTGFRIVGVTHILPPPPPTWEVIECECMDPNHCHINLPNGGYCTGECPPGFDCVRLGASSPDGTYEDIWCECLPTPVGVCCQPNSGCAITTAVNCPAPGVWHAEWSTCTPNPCTCALMGDLDGNGLRNGRDVQAFVTCVFGSGSYCPCGDFTHDGDVDASDISGFLSELLTGP